MLGSAATVAAQEPAPAAAPGQQGSPAPAAQSREGQGPEAAPAEPEAAGDASLEVGEATGEDTQGFIEAVGTEEVVVSGFQQSLSAALSRKQRSTAQVDAIVADDIADFPDLNLAEALQRIPGIAITRGSAGAAATNGEGAQITVRGLSGLYTRVRVNGMETRAAVGNNNTRNFDFSIFAAELFNSVVVHKTASADLDEGSLGAVVDLNTARAFNYKEGFTAVAGATGAYNDLSGTVRPRLTGLLAYRDPGGIWGATASAAYSTARNDAAAAETVRWQKSPFRSVNGVVCADAAGDPGCTDVTNAFHARIPRYGQQVNSAERLGLTAGLQFRPTPLTEVRLDGLYASYQTRTDLKWLELLFRGNEPTMDVTGYTLKAFPDRFGATNSTLVGLDVDHAWVRSERNRIDLESTYHQLSLAVDQRFNDIFYANLLGGTTRSAGRLPHDTTMSYDIRNYDGYSYNYSNDKYPQLVFAGPDVANAENYTLTELRDRQSKTTTGFDTVQLDLHADIFDELKLAAGVNFKRATLDTRGTNRDGTVCGFDLYECDSNGDGTDDLLGQPATPALSDITHYPGKVGAGSNTRWASPSIDDWNAAIGYSSVPVIADQDSTYKVTERNLGYYLQTKGEVALGVGDMRFLYDAGVRYVETRQTSSGYNSGVYVTIDREPYHDWLPSANAALWLTDALVLRLAAAQVMARPALANLSPGGTVDSFNFAINNQNPYLDPTRANALDLATEWYFADNSVLSLALFWKDIKSFPIRQSRTGTFASTGLPTSVIAPTSPAADNNEGTCGVPEGCWQISEITDGPGSKLKGLEVGFQAPFSAFYSHLPPVIRGLGVVANLTLVDSKADYDFSGNTVTDRLLGLSNMSYNATLYYEDSKFSARVSLAHRSDYLLNGPNLTGNLWEFNEPDTRLDFSSSYDVTKNLKLSLEALNLLDTPTATRVDIDANRRVLYNHTGRNVLLGARFTY